MLTLNENCALIDAGCIISTTVICEKTGAKPENVKKIAARLRNLMGNRSTGLALSAELDQELTDNPALDKLFADVMKHIPKTEGKYCDFIIPTSSQRKINDSLDSIIFACDHFVKK